MRILLALLAILFLGFASAHGQTLTPHQQIEAAIKPAPESMRASATVLGYVDADTLVSLREGTGDLICLADRPGNDHFHVACYHTSLEPFMARGRQLKAEGYDTPARDSIRQAEIEAGTLPMPEQAAALYSLTTRPDRYDLKTGEINMAHALSVVYLPHATVESTGLPPKAPAGEPWIMEPGTPWAHIMLVRTHGGE